MPITIELDLSEEELNQLARILRCKVGDLETTLEPYARAATEEYVRMFLGQRVFTRGSDMREYRLFLLIKEALDNGLPSEQRVCDLFQTTRGESRSLLRSVMSKYQYLLEDALEVTLRNTLENVKTRDNHYVITVNSKHVVEQLNQRVESLDGTLPPIRAASGSISCYEVQPSAFSRLCDHFKIPMPSDVEG